MSLFSDKTLGENLGIDVMGQLKETMRRLEGDGAAEAGSVDAHRAGARGRERMACGGKCGDAPAGGGRCGRRRRCRRCGQNLYGAGRT